MNILFTTTFMLEKLEGDKTIERINVDNLDDLFARLGEMQLQSTDFVLLDLDGTLRNEEIEFAKSDSLINKAQRLGVRHGFGIRTPDVLAQYIWEKLSGINAKKAIVTDNTYGGHFLTLPWKGERWFEKAVDHGVEIFSIDSTSIERNKEKSGLGLFLQRFRYLDALLMQIIVGRPLGFVKNLLNKTGRGNSSEYAFDERYKALSGRNAKAIGDVSDWILKQELQPGTQIIMVGDEETDYEFFEKLMEQVRSRTGNLLHAYYFNL